MRVIKDLVSFSKIAAEDLFANAGALMIDAATFCHLDS